ncbi:MAG: hypothetical protein ACI8TF_002299, partial [Paracoccaceae bacterium]
MKNAVQMSGLGRLRQTVIAHGYNRVAWHLIVLDAAGDLPKRTPPARAVFSGDVRFCIVCSHEQQHPPPQASRFQRQNWASSS